VRADGGEAGPAEDLDRLPALELGQVQLDILHEPRQVGHHQQHLVAVAADEGEHAVVVGVEEL
jgi:hypothetical protein